MKQVSIGFLFSEDTKSVALLLRSFGSELLWTGIGGNVDTGETFEQAMSREFFEEAGLRISNWREFCILHTTEAEIHFFVAFSNYVFNAKRTGGDERDLVLVFSSMPENIHPNLKFLLPLALTNIKTTVCYE